MRRQKPIPHRNLLEQHIHSLALASLCEPEWHVVRQISLPGGNRAYALFSTLLANGTGAIVKDKDHTHFFLKKMGYPTVRKSKTFFSDAWAQMIGGKALTRTIPYAHRYALEIGYPVFVKPNDGGRGRNVVLAHTQQELENALRDIFSLDRVALIQKPFPGSDIRVVVYKGATICAYLRTPLTLIGDGIHTIKKLLETTCAESAITLHTNDSRIISALKKQGRTKNQILKAGETLTLLDNANLSTGGTALDITTELHPSFKKIAIEVTRDFSLNLAGIDFIIKSDYTKPAEKNRYTILEINSMPGLDHYAKLGEKERGRVEKLYQRMLKDLSH